MVSFGKPGSKRALDDFPERRRQKRQHLIGLALGIVIILLVGFISTLAFFRLDLTAEQRYTLAPTTRQLLESLDDVVYVKFYLEGENLPAGFRKLRNATREMLEEFRVQANDNLQYELIDPLSGEDQRTRNEVGRELKRKGLMPTSVEHVDSKGQTEQLVLFPGALIVYKGRELAVDLLKNNIGADAEENLNLSVETLEFELVSAIRRLQITQRKKIAFLEGHGELRAEEVYDFTRSLSDFYEISRVRIDGKLDALKGFAGLVVAGPDSTFSDKDKFIIDQFIMHGGRALWLIDGTTTSMDSLSHSSETLGMVRDVNLTDLLFRYGVRVNPNLVMDIQSAYIPVNTAPAGSEPQFKPFSWYYFPLLMPTKHLISLNLNLVKGEFASVVDSVGNDSGLKKHVLLTTSRFSRVLNAPARVSLDIINTPPEEQLYNQSFKPIAFLMEGNFKSLYTNRLSPDILNSPLIRFKAESLPNRMIVIGDADIIRNHFKGSGEEAVPLPLGFDRYTGQVFGNKDFALNCVNYLLDDASILAVRSRELKIRMLDRDRVNQEGLFWKTLNTLAPVVFVLLVGLVFGRLRKARFSKK